MENKRNISRLISGIKNVFITGAILIFISILVVACVNYFQINRSVQKTTIALNNHLCIDNFQNKTIDYYNDNKKIKNRINDYSMTIKDLTIGIIDSNVLTFLYSFLFLFFGGFLFYIVTGAEKRIKESENLIKKSQKIVFQVDVDRGTIYLYTQILSLQVLATSIQSSLESKNYCIEEYVIMQICKIHKMTYALVGEIREDKYKYITKEYKNVLNDIIENMIYAFDLERIIKTKSNVKKTNPIKETIKVLNELKREISRLKEID